jgi:hypothetical protein
MSLWLERDIGYARAVFWLARPVLLKNAPAVGPALVAVLLLENSFACWRAYILAAQQNHQRFLPAVALLVPAMMQVKALRTTDNPSLRKLAG